MAIRVTCASCHTRFNVSEKFAGKEGPCPKCKTKIKIPSASEKVKIHAPEITGPKNVKGESVLKPIERTETVLTGIHITIIASLIVAFLVCAVVLNFMFPDKSGFPSVLLWISAIVIGPPITYGAYTFLRDQELGSFLGKELWYRVAIASVLYALLWFAMPLGSYAFSDNYETGSWILALVIMLGGGGAIGMLAFDFDYIIGLVHYGLYLGICLIGRFLAGIGMLPGSLEQPAATPSPGINTGPAASLEWWDSLAPLMAMLGLG